jgi:MFS family permease
MGSVAARGTLLPLALAQFVCSYAASNMNVAINDIATDLSTSVSGVQVAITVFTLTMAALMISGSKLTDIWGRKRCFTIGLYIYGAGAVVASFASEIWGMIVGYSLLEGIGSALLIPPVYILATVAFTDLKGRAKAFGIISAMGGVGAAAGPLIGGFITTATSWRVSFLAQALLVVIIIFLSRKITDPGVVGKRPVFDVGGAILSAAGLFAVVIGILQIKTFGLFVAKADFAPFGNTLIPAGSISPVIIFICIGLALLAWFFIHIRRREKHGKAPLIKTALFKVKTSNIALFTQLVQWFVLLGSSFVISVYLQVVRGMTAIETGLALTPATLGLLISSFAAGRLAKHFAQKTLIIWGFILTIGGIVLILIIRGESAWYLAPGLFIMGLGIGAMLTSSVNVVQSSFSEQDQGEISGLSRSVSNLGSSLGTAIAGTVLIAAAAIGNASYAVALGSLVLFGLTGLLAAFFLPHHTERKTPLLTS